MFGHVPKLACKHGYNTNISREEEAKILRLIKRDKSLDMMLHEILGEGWEKEILQEAP